MRRTLLEVASLVSVPAVLIICVLMGIDYTALVTTLVVALSLIPFIIGLERDNLKPKNIMPIVVLSALAVAGRVIFAAFPNVKPVSAIVIMAGVIFGRRSGFITGLLAALVSNVFFGQGPWTLWQMYAWGLMGYVAGTLAEHDIIKGRVSVMVFGAIAPFGYTLILDSYYIFGFLTEISLQAVFVTIGLGMMGAVAHSIATVGFLALIYLPWVRKLERIKTKYGIIDEVQMRIKGKKKPDAPPA